MGSINKYALSEQERAAKEFLAAVTTKLDIRHPEPIIRRGVDAVLNSGSGDAIQALQESTGTALKRLDKIGGGKQEVNGKSAQFLEALLGIRMTFGLASAFPVKEEELQDVLATTPTLIM